MEVHAFCGCLTRMCSFSALRGKQCLAQSSYFIVRFGMLLGWARIKHRHTVSFMGYKQTLCCNSCRKEIACRTEVTFKKLKNPQSRVT